MKKIFLAILSLALLIALGVYLNKAYARIYRHIGDLPAPAVYGSLVAASGASDRTNVSYVALGDSLTAGVGTQSLVESYEFGLAKKLAGNDKKVELTVLATPGMKTSDIIEHYLDKAISQHPNIITLLIGINDMHDRTPLSRFQKEYDHILKRLSSETSARIYVIGLPYLGPRELMRPPFQGYFAYQTQRYDEMIRRLAKDHGLKYVDLFDATVEEFKDSKYYSSDLYHPSAEGYKIWADIIYADINQ